MPETSALPDWVSWLVVLVAIVLGLWLLRLVLVLLNLLRHLLQRPAYRKVDEGSCPPWVLEGLQPVIAELQEQGFELQGWLGVRRLFAVARDEVVRALLRAPDGVTWCTVGFADLPDPLHLFHVVFTSFLDDGTALFTVNGTRHTVVGEIPDVRLEDPMALDATAQWQHHARTLAAMPERRAQRADSVDALLGALLRAENRYLDEMLKRGWLVPATQPDRFRFSLVAASAGAWRILRGQGALTKLRQQRAAALRARTQAPLRVPVEEEAGAFADIEVIRHTPSPRSFWLALFGSSLILFMLAATRWLDPNLVWMVAAAVLLHELGHYSAMRAFDYNNTAIFFVPFFGAATSGSKRDAPLWQELLVLLAGPVPGLVLAAAVLGLHRPEAGSSLHELLSILIVLNLFNLLPIFPLDGGRVVHRLLFAHNRVLDAGFKLLAAGAFLGLGLASNDGLMIALGVFVVIGIPTSLRLAGLQRRLGRRRQDDGEASLTPRLVFEVMQEAGQGSMPFAVRVQQARALLEQGGGRERPGCLPALGWLLVYGLSVLGAGALLLWLFLGSGAGSSTPSSSIPALDTPPVAIACPADAEVAWGFWRHRPVEEAVSRSTVHLWMIAGFDSAAVAEAGGRAMTAEAPPRGLLRFENLLLWQRNEAPGPTDLPLGLLEPGLESLGARVMTQSVSDDEGSLVELRCTPRSAAQREQLVRELQDHFAGPPGGFLRPPWWPREGQETLPRAQQDARRAYRELNEATTAALMESTTGLTSWRGTVSLCLASDDAARQEQMLQWMEEHRQRRLRAAEQYLQAHQDEPGFDAGTVEIYMRALRVPPGDVGAQQQLQRELAERMGALALVTTGEGPPQPAAEAMARLIWAMPVDTEGGTLRLTALSMANPQAALPSLLSYLCARGCHDLDLRHSGDALQGEDP